MASLPEHGFASSASKHHSERPRPPDAVHLPRSASYTYISHAVKDFEESTIVELNGTTSEDEQTNSNGSTESNGAGRSRSSSDSSTETKTPAPIEVAPSRPSFLKRASRSRSASLFSNKDKKENAKPESAKTAGSAGTDSSRARSPVRSFSRLRRKSWMSAPSSRDPSREPSRGPPREPIPEAVSETRRRRSQSASGSASRSVSRERSRDASPMKSALKKKPSKPELPSRRNSWILGAGRHRPFTSRNRDNERDEIPEGTEQTSAPLQVLKRPRRPMTVLLKDVPLEQEDEPPTPKASVTHKSSSASRSSRSSTPKVLSPGIPAVPPLPVSFSTDKLSSYSKLGRPMERISPLARNRSYSSDKLKTSRSEPARKKDELWNVFRTLDGDFQK